MQSTRHHMHIGADKGIVGTPPPPGLFGPLFITICKCWKMTSKSLYLSVRERESESEYVGWLS